MIMSFKVLSFFLFAYLWLGDFKLPEILTRKTVGSIQKITLFPGKILVCGWNLHFWKLIEYTNDHSLDAPMIPTF